MERLTQRLRTGEALMASNCEEKYTEQEWISVLQDRLAAYEDTGLDPREVSAIVKEWSELCTIVGECGGIDHLRELAEADKDGRVVVLPCKVGDKLYRVFYGEIFEHRVGSMKYFAIQGRWDIETYPFCPYVEESIGKTVFLTRKGAEEALEAMRKEEAP